jgi:PAS domain S-box-containing protein
MFRSYYDSIWRSYKAFVVATIQLPIDHQVRDIDFWQKKIFTTVVLYGIPLSFLTLVPSVYLESRSGSWLTASFEIFSTIAFSLIALGPGLSLKMRKLLSVSIVAFVAVALPIFFGEFSVCCTYLLSLSTFVALVYSNKTAYLMVLLNFLVLISYAFIIRYHVFNLHLVMDTTFDRWIVYSLNFVLMNVIVVGLIRQILNGLVRTIRKETWLLKELRKEMARIAELNHTLQTSKEDYKTLFSHSPLPKLIFDIDTLKFLQVNLAAVEVYGFTEPEFVEMKLTDIHPADHTNEMIRQVLKDDNTGPLLPYKTLHVGKDGRLIHAEVRRSNITFKGRKARMITSTDISKQVAFTAAIQQQNDKLREIAYIQSHVIRHPLTRIMSISELINLEYQGHVDPELLKYLDVSTAELDAVIRDVVIRSEEVLSKLDR